MAKKKKPAGAGTARKRTVRRRKPDGAVGSSRKRSRRLRENPAAASPAEGAPAPAGGANPGFAVVGIGASAGGLEAFRQFFSALSGEPGMAFVLIQHLAPDHESLTAELLARHTKMPVLQATHDLQIEANHVYVIPPKRYLALSGDKLRLSTPVERRGLRVPIDFFFRSLAEDQQERAIGILLSGTGSDGTNGVREIKAAGGMVMVQAPETTTWEGMPRSAIATGVVDYILPIEKMPAVLRKYVKHWYVNGDGRPRPVVEKAPGHLNTIIGLLRAGAKYDFSSYKQGTLVRRIQRRMGLNHIPDTQKYIDLMRQSKEELAALSKDMLISVTSFLREPNAWGALEQEVIAPLVKSHGPETAIRIWVAGCATGEEAYSLAMLVLSQAQRQEKVLDVHIFASDIDHDALAFARAGVYPESIAADVPPDLLRRYFIKGEHTYRVCKEMREMVVFAEQNVISDPPFSKLDLISCRNVLIYLESEVQKKILSLFHFALLEGGCLFLGSSEAVNQQRGLFEPVSRKLRIYRRVGDPKVAPVGVATFPRDRTLPRLDPAAEARDPRSRRLASVAQYLIAQRFAPTCAVINRNSDVIYLHGAVDQYLQVQSGELGSDLSAMAREGLRTKLRAAIHKAIRENAPVTIGGISLKRDRSYIAVRIRVEPIGGDGEREGLYLVTFETDPPAAKTPAAAAPAAETAAAPHAHGTDGDYELIISQLEEHLRTTREDLQSTIEELETSNEELKAANEEVTSINEELQSTNEELETSKEELQSLNEEMQTVNHQLEEKVLELESTNNDLDNLLLSAEVATILLDRQFRLRRFTQATGKLLRVISSDVGRPISDLAKMVVDDDLLPDAQRVLKNLTPITKDVQDGGGRSYLRRITPYRTDDNRIDGVVITFVDVTDRKERERVLEQYSDQLEKDVAERTAVVDSQARELVDMAETERRQLGRELHDTLSQQLTAIGVMAATLKDPSASPPAQAEAVERLETSIDEAKRQIRAMIRGLFPVDVDADGLRVALDYLVREIESIFRVTCRFEHDDNVAVAENFTATQLFLIAREAIQNAARHSQARHIVVRLEERDGIRLSVEDDGKGLAKDSTDGDGMGLRIMRHRSELIGGKLQLTSLDGRGTRVSVHVRGK
jgi:two-component system CheB/CheR fusion protein